MSCAEVRKLLIYARVFVEGSSALSATAHLVVLHNKAHVAQIRGELQRHKDRRAARLLQATISTKLDAGLLPEGGAAITSGAPGAGGRCDACENLLQPTQLVVGSVQASIRVPACGLLHDLECRAALARASELAQAWLSSVTPSE